PARWPRTRPRRWTWPRAPRLLPRPLRRSAPARRRSRWWWARCPTPGVGPSLRGPANRAPPRPRPRSPNARTPRAGTPSAWVGVGISITRDRMRRAPRPPPPPSRGRVPRPCMIGAGPHRSRHATVHLARGVARGHAAAPACIDRPAGPGHARGGLHPVGRAGGPAAGAAGDVLRPGRQPRPAAAAAAVGAALPGRAAGAVRRPGRDRRAGLPDAALGDGLGQPGAGRDAPDGTQAARTD